MSLIGHSVRLNAGDRLFSTDQARQLAAAILAAAILAAADAATAGE